jgi:hypothetical protein
MKRDYAILKWSPRFASAPLRGESTVVGPPELDTDLRRSMTRRQDSAVWRVSFAYLAEALFHKVWV